MKPRSILCISLGILEVELSIELVGVEGGSVSREFFFYVVNNEFIFIIYLTY